MIKIHKEGRMLLLVLFLALTIVNTLLFFIFDNAIVPTIALVISIGFFIFFTHFFRSPERIVLANEHYVVAPADGKIVVIEPVEEHEYLKEKRLQVSIFMSPFDVHANWYPIAGKVIHVAHHDGRKMAAYLPKSSTENERSTVVIETQHKQLVLMRQIAGALARRIVTYAKVGDNCKINQQFGFIKFGSRVDLYLPLDSEILVDLNEEVVGNETIIAKLKHEV